MVYLLPRSCPREFYIPDDLFWQRCNACSKWRRLNEDEVGQRKQKLFCQTLGFPCEKPEEAQPEDIDYLMGEKFPNGRQFIEQKWVECDHCHKLRWIPEYLTTINGEGAFKCEDIHFSCNEPPLFSEKQIDFLLGLTPKYYIPKEKEIQPISIKQKRKAKRKREEEIETEEIVSQVPPKQPRFSITYLINDYDKKQLSLLSHHFIVKPSIHFKKSWVERADIIKLCFDPFMQKNF